MNKFQKTILFFAIIFFPFFSNADIADDILSKMTLDEKIGQLFMIPACPKKDIDHFNELIKLLDDYHLGGVIVKASDAPTQINFLNKLQSLSKYPLLVSADAEWGLAMRMDGTIAFPRNMTLGAIQDENLIYEMGKEIGNELKAVGVHINLAPVVDINNNPSNPIINVRSFSDDKYNVTKKAMALIHGMQDVNIIACIKHFPGYGDIHVDPHLNLPISNHDLKRLNEIEFYPYDSLIKDGVLAIMTAHITIPLLSSLPATMSKEVLDILINEKKFKNLIITDALNMKALTNHYSFEDIAYLAHMAGNDILLYGDHIGPNIEDIFRNQIPRAFNAIKKAYLENKLSETKLNFHVLKILKAKEKLKLFENRFIKPYDPKIILSKNAFDLKRKLFANALTIVKNESLPLDLNKNILYLSTKNEISDDLIANNFSSSFKCFNINNLDNFYDLSSYDKIIIGIYESDLTDDLINKIKKISKKNVVIFFFGSIYKIKPFLDFENIVFAYEEDNDAIFGVIDFISHKIEAKGVLPLKHF